jgi:uncharacterized protein (TIGR00645 family)
MLEPGEDARGREVPKTTFEKLLFACRWLLAPFYVALVVALIELLVRVVMHAYGIALQFASMTEDEAILGALGVVDLTLTACLVVLVIFSTYSNFVARLDPSTHEEWPSWMVGIDYGELKLKLVASIVAISSIKLLESYMNVQHETNRDLAWQMSIFGAFVGAALLLGISEAVGRAYNGRKN